jgi:hypothetical protein
VDELRVRAGTFMLAADMHLSLLSIAPGATLDARSRSLAVHATAGTRDAVAAQLNALVASARNTSPQLWKGPGLGTSSATGTLTTLAVVPNRDGSGAARYSTFAGQPVDANTVLVKFTYAGDADANGRVNIDDYFAIDRGRAMGLSGYANGDFNYSGGPPNGDDYFLIDAAYLGQGAPLNVAGVRPLVGAVSPVFSTEPVETGAGLFGESESLLT